MRFSMSKLAAALVVPSEPTPSGNLPLSSIDRTTAVRVTVDLILVFEHGEEPAKVIREALSKALLPYYPVAGRIVEPNSGEPEVACTGDGVWFVEASANFGLKDVNNLERPLMIPKEELLPCPPPQVNAEDVILMMQVTKFTCGGFVVGIRFSHTVFDGLGVSQFLKAATEVATGVTQPTVAPVWCREAIPNPPKRPQGEPPSFTAFPFENSIIDLPLDGINHVRDEFIKETGHKCSIFDVITAMVWQGRTRAIDLESHVEVRLGFAANVRHLLHEVLPQGGGFYGNCVFPVGITSTSGKIKHASLVEVVSLITEAKESLATKFSEWLVGDPKEDAYRVPLDYGTLMVSDWSRVGFSEVDFGWGEPIHVSPLNDDCNVVASCIYLKPPKPKQGVRLMTRCVVMEHLASFDDLMIKSA
uniref:Acyl transferase 5 n=1 Tax=Elaeis guineensis var. tenera TaxID=51953 RepID=A0A6I9QMP2_ELAGV|nr:acyl transferase 5 [Elaeis guineensis]